MSRVLLLNPPGTKNYIRDYFCSKLSKSYYKSAPATLLALSGVVAEAHTVTVLDAIVENLPAPAALRRCVAARPDAVVALVGAASWDEDREFLRQLKAATGATLIAIGDLLLEDTEARLAEAPAIDAALLSFATPDVLALLPKPEGTPVPNAVVRLPAGQGYLAGPRPKLRGEYHLPRPRHELFPLRRYRFPFAVARPMAVVLTDYGCPFQCTFCVIPSLGFALRPLADVLEELAVVRGLGVRELFFIDQTFGARPARTLELLRALCEPKYAFRWSCFSRADVTTPEMLALMARSGCHTIIYGVESGNEATLTRYHKQLDLAQMRATFTACRRLRIRTAATFMLGLPGETAAQARATLALALSLPLDFAAFNVAVPRAATRLRAESIAAGLIGRELRSMDQSGLDGAMGTAEMTSQAILALRREAIRRFYLRPGYLGHRLFDLRSWWDFKTQAADGIGVLMEALKKN
jgi:anaerobic magnesium-protoporphyrin IX monomethyl ester cyclase